MPGRDKRPAGESARGDRLETLASSARAPPATEVAVEGLPRRDRVHEVDMVGAGRLGEMPDEGCHCQVRAQAIGRGFRPVDPTSRHAGHSASCGRQARGNGLRSRDGTTRASGGQPMGGASDQARFENQLLCRKSVIRDSVQQQPGCHLSQLLDPLLHYCQGTDR